jgi:hypothetical protein
LLVAVVVVEMAMVAVVELAVIALRLELRVVALLLNQE